MDSFDLHVEQRGGIDAQPEAITDQAGKRPLVGVLNRRQALLQGVVAGLTGEATEDRGIVEDFGTAHLAQKSRQSRVCLVQPAAEGDPVGLVNNAVWIKAVKF